MIIGNTIGAILKNPETIILRTEDGQEYAAAMTTEEVILSAGVDDVREGETFASQQGVKTGEKCIPAYHTKEGFKVILDGEAFELTNLSEHNLYDFTKLQGMVSVFNTTVSDSVCTNKVVIDEKIYDTNSTIILSTLTRDSDNKSIDFGIINSSGKTQIIRYIMYKET